jgi:hypothetical protein
MRAAVAAISPDLQLHHTAAHAFDLADPFGDVCETRLCVLVIIRYLQRSGRTMLRR